MKSAFGRAGPVASDGTRSRRLSASTKENRIRAVRRLRERMALELRMLPDLEAQPLVPEFLSAPRPEGQHSAPTGSFIGEIRA